MDVGTTQFLCRHHLAGCGFYQRWSPEKNRALIAHDDALIGHRRNIGAAGRAGPHHDRDLRNAERGHLRLVVEDAAEMPLVRENIVLLGQERTTGVDHIDARQIILAGNVLGPQMLLHRHRIVGATLDGGVVGNDHAFAPRDPSHARDDARRMHVSAVEVVSRQRRQFEKGRAGIDQEIDAFARQHLAPSGMPEARGLTATAGHLIEFFVEVGDQLLHRLGVASKVG